MDLLKDIIIIFSISMGIIYICTHLKIPSIVGFLITGILAGPNSLALISSPHEVELLSEVGVILLLFSIGMEFSIKHLMHLKRAVFLGGFLQVALTIAVVYLVFYLMGKPLGASLFYGFLVSLSSTAIVLKILQEKAEIDTPYGRSSLAILIFQDVIVVPMVLITPLLAGGNITAGDSFLIFLAKSAGVILFVIISIKWLVPWLFYLITKTRIRELFLLSVIVICFAIAWLTYSIGLSLALGAFLAGLIVSETEYSHEAIGNIIPFRDIFTSIFFISIGMLLDISYVISAPLLIIIIGLGILLGKFIITNITAMILGLPLRISLMAGFILCQIGEFSFILSKTGLNLGLLDKGYYQLFLAVSIFTMTAAPFIITYASGLSKKIMKIPFPRLLVNGLYHYSLGADKDPSLKLNDHIIIVGFGFTGRNVARSAKIAKIPYIIIEMNADTVRKERRKGENIFYGDASNAEVLNHAHASQARVIVITIPDAAATRRIVVLAPKLNSRLHIITRTRFVQQVDDLYKLGAHEVIPEEFETSVEIFTRVLKKYHLPENDITEFSELLRHDCYELYRCQINENAPLIDEIKRIGHMEFITYRVEKNSPASGKSIAQLDLRKKYGVTIIALYSGKDVKYTPGGEEMLKAEDILLLLGSPEDIAESFNVFRDADKASKET